MNLTLILTLTLTCNELTNGRNFPVLVAIQQQANFLIRVFNKCDKEIKIPLEGFLSTEKIQVQLSQLHIEQSEERKHITLEALNVPK